MNPKQPAVLFSRTYALKNGKNTLIWWYYVTDRYGKRHRYSLHTSSKTNARALLYEKIKSGDLWLAKGSSIRLQDFA